VRTDPRETGPGAGNGVFPQHQRGATPLRTTGPETISTPALIQKPVRRARAGSWTNQASHLPHLPPPRRDHLLERGRTSAQSRNFWGHSDVKTRTMIYTATC